MPGEEEGDVVEATLEAAGDEVTFSPETVGDVQEEG